MVLKIYNTRTRTVEEFKAERSNRVYMFVCGPTVYDHSHIGHARTYLAYDIIARYIRAKGYSLFYLMNITDVEDKIIDRANKTGQDPIRMADAFTREFMRDLEALGITSVNLYAKASEHVPEIIAQVATLVRKGFAYQVDGDVYYDVSKFTDYGKLSGQRVDELSTHRIDPDPRKKNTADFALWKAQKPGEPYWESPWGKGRPGWHIEDTAITTTYFGPTYDIHGGGLDLVFPHHEAEIAQAEAATGVKPLVRYWVHGGLLMISGERMGHSMGNFVTIAKLLQRHDSEALRLYYAMRHYRTQLNFDEEKITEAEEVLDKLRSTYNQFAELMNSKSLAAEESIAGEVETISQKAVEEFDAAMDEDFNTPRALATLIAYSKDIEPYADRPVGKLSVERVVKTFDYFGGVFGILRAAAPTGSNVVGRLLEVILRMRDKARRKGDWATSDRLRDEVTKAGIGLEDTRGGTRWYIASSLREESR